MKLQFAHSMIQNYKAKIIILYHLLQCFERFSLRMHVSVLFFVSFRSFLIFRCARKSIAGGFNSRTLPIIFAVVQPKWARVSGNVHTDRHARDTRMHCAGCNQRIHHNSLNGHENHAHGQKVSRVSCLCLFILVAAMRSQHVHIN